MTTYNGLSAPQLGGARWRKSSHSQNAGGDCVEVATNLIATHGAVGVRDSKDPQGAALLFDPASFASFIDDLRVGRLAAPGQM